MSMRCYALYEAVLNRDNIDRGLVDVYDEAMREIKDYIIENDTSVLNELEPEEWDEISNGFAKLRKEMKDRYGIDLYPVYTDDDSDGFFEYNVRIATNFLLDKSLRDAGAEVVTWTLVG